MPTAADGHHSQGRQLLPVLRLHQGQQPAGALPRRVQLPRALRRHQGNLRRLQLRVVRQAARAEISM